MTGQSFADAAVDFPPEKGTLEEPHSVWGEDHSLGLGMLSLNYFCVQAEASVRNFHTILSSRKRLGLEI